MLISAILFTIFQTVNSTSTTVQTGVDSNAQVQAFQRDFGEDIRNAKGVMVTSFRVDAELANGQCKSWNLYGGTIFTTTNASRVAFDYYKWRPVLDGNSYYYVNGEGYGTIEQPFSKSGAQVSYSFMNGSSTRPVWVNGSSTQRLKSSDKTSRCFATEFV
jgi:hypothetical protein